MGEQEEAKSWAEGRQAPAAGLGCDSAPAAYPCERSARGYQMFTLNLMDKRGYPCPQHSIAGLPAGDLRVCVW